MAHQRAQTPKLPTGRPGRVRRAILDAWPLLIWIAMLFLTVYGYTAGVKFKRMNGTVGVYQEAISPEETGRLVEVFVKQGDQVEANQVVAQMDTGVIDSEIRQLEREIRADREDRLRRFRSDVVELKAELREYEIDRKGDEAKLKSLEKELGELEELVANGILQQEDVAELRSDVKELEAKLPLYDDFIKDLQTALAEAETQLAAVITNYGESGSADASDAEELKILQRQKEQMSLRAVHAGAVYLVEKEPGEIIVEGETVVRVVAKPENIVGFLPQEQVDKVSVGDPVWISSTSDRHTTFPSRVIAISPRISNTPDRASPLPNKMLRGREVIVELPEEAGFLPGQTVIIHIDEPGALPFLN